MAKLLKVEIKEDADYLKTLLSKCNYYQKARVKMLLLITQGITATNDLAFKTKSNRDTIRNWKNKYNQTGLAGLLEDHRGGRKFGSISEEDKAIIKAKLSNPKEAFNSYKEAINWINGTFGLSLSYSGTNAYLKRNFQTKLKVGRKSHIKKDEAAAAVFKKPI